MTAYRMQPYTGDDWHALTQTLPERHFLQSWQWAEIKCAYGWEKLPLVWHDAQGVLVAAAMVLRRSIKFAGLPLCILYAPKAPLLAGQTPLLLQQVLHDLQCFARQQKAIFIKIDPDIQLGTGVPGTPTAQADEAGDAFVALLQQTGWQYASDQIQFKNTVMIDLEGSEEAILARMKQKTRYNIRLAQRHGVTVRAGCANDLQALYAMYAATAVRDDFVIRAPAYYLDVWRTFMQAGMCQPLIAEVDGEMIAAVIIFIDGSIARYVYGMSTEKQREKMPNYLLQWEAMRYSKQSGCHYYDMWGAPDEFNEQDSMWRVFRFKEGFGGFVLRTPGAYDYPARPFLYQLYTKILPRVLNFMRRRGKAETRKRIIG